MTTNRTFVLVLLATALLPAAIAPAISQVSRHAKYIESVRKAFKSPVDSQELYRLVIQPEFNQTLHEAASAGEDALVVELLQAYSGQNSDRERGGTALVWAAYYSDATLIKILLQRGLNVNAIDKEGNTPLHRALEVGRVDIVALLLEKNPDVNAANQEGDTPLMLAAADNQAINTQAFLDRGADVNAQNKKGETPLMFAARNGRLANVRLLLSEGANVNLKDKEGNTALMIATKSPGAPYAGFHDSPGELDPETADKLAAQAKSDLAAIIQRLKRTSGK